MSLEYSIRKFGDIVEENGRTIRENHMDIPHNLKVGQLVEVKHDAWHNNGACEKIHARLWIVEYSKKVKKTLADRTHNCPHCGLVMDRDLNAAKNILSVGTTQNYAYGDLTSTHDHCVLEQVESVK